MECGPTRPLRSNASSQDPAWSSFSANSAPLSVTIRLYAQRTIFPTAASGSCNGRASAFGSHTSRMQELVLTRPGTAAQTEWTREPESEPVAAAELRREFEERLAECGPLAFRVARGVLRNSADAEDVAQEAVLRAYRRFPRLRDRSSFRAWLVRITFRLALDRARSSNRREQRETQWAQPAPRASTEDLAASSEFQAAPRASRSTNCRRSCGSSCCSPRWKSTRSTMSPQMLGLPIGTVKSRSIQGKKTVSGEVAMSCEKYKPALIEAAVTGADPRPRSAST